MLHSRKAYRRTLLSPPASTGFDIASDWTELRRGRRLDKHWRIKAAGAEWVGFVAEATNAAADSLDRNAPKLSSLVRETAQKVERFSRDLKDQSVQDLYRSASDFTRAVAANLPHGTSAGDGRDQFLLGAAALALAAAI